MSAVLLALIALFGGLLSIGFLLLLWVAQTLAGKEAEAIVQALTSDLLRRAERRLPPGQRSRFAEETRAGLQCLSTERPLWALLQAASLYCSAVGGGLVVEFEAMPEQEPSDLESDAVSKAYVSRLRISILACLKQRPVGPHEMAAELRAPPSLVYHHLRRLADEGLIEVAEKRQKRGVVVYLYRRPRRTID